MQTSDEQQGISNDDVSRRSFLTSSLFAMGAVGIGASVYAVSRTLEPDDNYLAQDPGTEFDLPEITVGQQAVVEFNRMPIIIRHRTLEEIESARANDVSSFKDPFANNLNLPKDASATDANRSFGPNGEYLTIVGKCTRSIACQIKQVENDGIYWFCPCCASRYDGAGRVISGPGPRNLLVPRFDWLKQQKTSQISLTLYRLGKNARWFSVY